MKRKKNIMTEKKPIEISDELLDFVNVVKKLTDDINECGVDYITYKEVACISDGVNNLKEKFNLKPKFFVPEHGESKGKKVPCHWDGLVRPSHPEAWKGEE